MSVSALAITVLVVAQLQQQNPHYTRVTRTPLPERVRVHGSMLAAHQNGLRSNHGGPQAWALGGIVGATFRLAPRLSAGAEIALTKPFRSAISHCISHSRGCFLTDLYQNTDTLAFVARIHTPHVEPVFGPARARIHSDERNYGGEFVRSAVAFVVGADGRIPISGRVAFAPTFRTYLVKRDFVLGYEGTALWHVGLGLSARLW